jgi:hypothetical protein
MTDIHEIFYCEYRCYVGYGDLILRDLDYIVIISFWYISYCVCLNLYCGGFKLFCNVCVCVCVCKGGFCNVRVF